MNNNLLKAKGALEYTRGSKTSGKPKPSNPRPTNLNPGKPSNPNPTKQQSPEKPPQYIYIDFKVPLKYKKLLQNISPPQPSNIRFRSFYIVNSQ
jgi:hypothetical protein